MTAVVISQPMLFPWVGLFEQIRLADIYVHYDDVQYSKGGFTNRVQIWNGTGVSWMTVPVLNSRLGLNIDEVEIDTTKNWKRKHIELLRQSYSKAPYQADMLEIVERVYGEEHKSIADLSMASIEAVCSYFGLADTKSFQSSSQLNIQGSSSRRVFDIVKYMGGTRYITGHGASHYLDHDMFEKASIDVEYMNYEKREYPQLGEQFTPYISILDLVANCGPRGATNICSETISWKEFRK